MNPRPLHQYFDAMYHGKFKFNDFLELNPKEHYKPIKLSGRTIYKPSKELKEFHSFINNFLLIHIPVNQKNSFAYRKGTNLIEAVFPHANSRAFYQTDIQNFFYSFDKEIVGSFLKRFATPIDDLNKYLDHILQLLTVDERLPIGYSTSPVLSNICMFDFDTRLDKVCNKYGWIYTRYADDIIISGNDRESLQNAKHEIEYCLHKELGKSFELNLKKSKLTTVGRKIKILGLVILPNGDIAIDGSVKDKIETKLFFYINNRDRLKKIFREEQDDDMDEGLQRLSGLISYVNTIDLPYLDKLRMKFGATVIDSFLHRSAL